ncbi:uncharacterized protein LOC131953102 [Physella acuta]|uniref:uncharacterized protein LOC131953102 n=1 Tax=Physella acuta TaxID=109671 RepID=UPI0027DBF088|nr:uncharacterized protein LOC131953102 [Physella acuta]
MHPWVQVFTLVLGVSLTRASFLLTISNRNLHTDVTDHVTLECSFWGDRTDSAILNVTKIEILKQRNATLFDTAAQENLATGLVSTHVISPTVVLSGNVGSVLQTFLKITWPVVTSDAIGHFRCDVTGFDSQQQAVTESSPVIAVQETEITPRDVLNFFLKQRDEIKAFCLDHISTSGAVIESHVSSVQENQTAENLALELSLKSELNTGQAAQDTEINNLKLKLNDLETKLTESEAAIKNLQNQLDDLKAVPVTLQPVQTYEPSFWPEGYFSLLMPDSGCPESQRFTWATGYRKFHTESGNATNLDAVSPNSHFKKPVMETNNTNHYMYQHFCVNNVSVDGLPWPNGSYCINKVAKSCPDGFHSGYIHWAGEISDPMSSASGSLPFAVITDIHTYFYYCCRADGPPTTPIHLPSAKPFYLYRYNGTCQHVTGMTAHPETMTFDTDSRGWDNYENNYHPDSQLHDVVFQTCYYQRDA